ncbi:hypothetical protein ACA910_003863 [Epithemia clementina (nom. ined.)]
MRFRLQLPWLLLVSQFGFSFPQQEEIYVDLDTGEIEVEMDGETSPPIMSEAAHHHNNDDHHDHHHDHDHKENQRKEKDRKIIQEFQAKLIESVPTLKKTSARDVAVMLKFALNDPDTGILLQNIKQGKDEKSRRGNGESKDDQKPDRSSQNVVEDLVQTVSDLQMSELLFQDPQRGFQQMKDEGLLPADKVEMYEKDPTLLKRDTRKSLYINFVTLAAEGGFL